MKITVINGTEKYGVTYRLKEMFLDQLRNDSEITEFYLPKDCPNFCLDRCICNQTEPQGSVYDERGLLIL